MRYATDPQANEGAKILALPVADLSLIDDEGLVRAFVAGNPRAPGVLWDRHARLVRRILQRTLGQQEDIEDLVQEAFLSLFRRLATLREPKALPSFLTSITINVSRHELRRRWLGRFVGLSAKGDAESDARVVQPNPEARQAVRLLYKILDQLGSEERLAFVLRFIEGMELTEVATALGVSLATAKRRLGRARERFDHHVAKNPGLAAYASGIEGESP